MGVDASVAPPPPPPGLWILLYAPPRLHARTDNPNRGTVLSPRYY